jgi:hypothetical protein
MEVSAFLNVIFCGKKTNPPLLLEVMDVDMEEVKRTQELFNSYTEEGLGLGLTNGVDSEIDTTQAPHTTERSASDGCLHKRKHGGEFYLIGPSYPSNGVVEDGSETQGSRDIIMKSSSEQELLSKRLRTKPKSKPGPSSLNSTGSAFEITIFIIIGFDPSVYYFSIRVENRFLFYGLNRQC